MRLFALAFLLGILLLQNFTILPDKKWIWIVLIFALILLRQRYLRWFAACALGFVWCLWYVHSQVSWTLPKNWEGKNLIVTGHIATIPVVENHRVAFLFKLKKIQYENSMQVASSLLRLTWQGDVQKLHVGDVWRLTVRLKRIHGLMNPGSFDYEAWALQEGIRAQGYVHTRAESKLLNHHPYYYLLARVRQYLKEKIEKNLPATPTSPWILALTVGERHGISPENWEVLRNTGTNHLMAIAGLHIGFMSGFAYTMVFWLWRQFPRLVYKIPAQHAGSIAALIMALMYSALAGFLLPTQRACIMLTVFLVIVLLRRKILAWHAWSLALILVLLMNPLSVLTESFWLSFVAVAAIILGMRGRLLPRGWWWQWGRTQWVIGLGLLPFSIWLFQQYSLVSFFANSIAIPWVGFLIVPLSLFGVFLLLFSAKLGGMILLLADKLLSWLWVILAWFSHLSWGSWYQAMPNHWILLAACFGVILMLLPSGFPGRLLGLLGFLPLIFHSTPTLTGGEVRLTLLDVGQGLATVVQTQHHILVFDAGPKLSPNFDMGESVVIPYLRTLGVKQIDMLVVSHGDNDHVGGAEAILKRLRVMTVKTSVPEQLSFSQATYCLRGESWDWDGVNFRFLYPSIENLNLGNNSSCVLRITHGNKHILLTGDIEKYAENYLWDTERQILSANIIVAPHHGSKTSAADHFLQAVSPQIVLFPVGYRNRYHFPNEWVVKKYDALGVKKMDTAQAGAIEIRVANNNIARPISYRALHHHYWNSD